MRALLLSLAVACLAAGCGSGDPAPTPAAVQTDPAAAAAARDAAIQSASEQARASLARFWELQANNDGDAFWLKVAYATPDGGSEQIWLNRVRGGPEGLTGVVQNAPQNIPSLQLNQRAPINTNQITDWSITRDGRTYGHFTTRAIISFESPEAQAQQQEFLDSLETGLP